MQKHRFFLTPDRCLDELLLLSDRDARHAAKVLRLRPDDEIFILNGVGLACRCRLVTSTSRRVEARVLERTTHPEAPSSVTLCQGLLKAKSMEWMLQKAAELGVARIVPVVSDHAVPTVHAGGNKMQKWTATLIEAIKQSGNPWLPRLTEPMSLAAALAVTRSDDLNLLAALTADSCLIKRRLEAFRASRGRRERSVALWVGPEGDFGRDEYAALLAAGCEPVTLGPNVLRSETAAIAGAAVLQYELSS